MKYQCLPIALRWLKIYVFCKPHTVMPHGSCTLLSQMAVVWSPHSDTSGLFGSHTVVLHDSCMVTTQVSQWQLNGSHTVIPHKSCMVVTHPPARTGVPPGKDLGPETWEKTRPRVPPEKDRGPQTWDAGCGRQ